VCGGLQLFHEQLHVCRTMQINGYGCKRTKAYPKHFSFFFVCLFTFDDEKCNQPILMKDYYILKIRGVNNMPDFVQIRDEKFTLVSYFRADRADRKRLAAPDSISDQQISELIQSLPYGQICKLPYGGQSTKQ
jgi:hypothetical protein